MAKVQKGQAQLVLLVPQAQNSDNTEFTVCTCSFRTSQKTPCQVQSTHRQRVNLFLLLSIIGQQLSIITEILVVKRFHRNQNLVGMVVVNKVRKQVMISSQP